MNIEKMDFAHNLNSHTEHTHLMQCAQSRYVQIVEAYYIRFQWIYPNNYEYMKWYVDVFKNGIISQQSSTFILFRLNGQYGTSSKQWKAFNQSGQFLNWIVSKPVYTLNQNEKIDIQLPLNKI